MNLTFDYYHNLQETEFYLCNPDGRELFPIVGFDRKLTLRFNDLSQLTFGCYSTTTSNDGTIVNVDAYEYVQTRRLIFATGIGWFVITNVEEIDNGITKTKNVTCDSLQATLKDRGFYCEERVYYFYNPSDPTDTNYDPNDDAHIPSVMGQLYQQLGIQQDLQQGTSDPSTPYDDWTITYINPDLVGKGRNFKESTDYGYEWIVKSVEEAYGVIVLFDFFYKTIHVMKPSEVTAKANVIYTFSNFMKEVEIEESAENIVTVMDCKGDNCNIIGVNPTGTDYICDFSYYMDDAGRWMSSALKAKINAWKAAVEAAKPGYEEKVQQLRAAYGNLTSVQSTLQEVSKIYQDLATAVSEKAVAIASGKVATLGNLPAGTKIKIPHSVYGNIIFQIADQNHDGYPSNSTTLITEKIILLRCFDAKEPSNPNSDRANNGNNKYSVSNIDQWLNSSASVGQWYSARHEYDAPPTNANVYNGYNEYDQDAGFLKGFDEAFVGALKDTTLTVALNTETDGGGSETITRKMFLASRAEVFGSAENGIMEGSRLAIFAEDTSASRIAKVSAYAAAHSEYSVTENQNLHWFLRTPSSANSRSARIVNSSGTQLATYAYYGYGGVRPLCNLDSGIFVSLDADGNYVLSDNPGGIVWCETVNVGETSIDDESVVYHNALSREMIITVYKDQPSYDQNAKAWQFSGSSFTGTLDECFAYTDEGNYAYRYFSDYLSSGDTYCVLQGDTRVNPTTYAVEYVCKGFKRYTALVLANGWTQKYDARKTELKSLQETYESTVDEKREELAEISESLNIISFFSDTPLLLKELHHYWIEGEYTNDNIVVDERTTNEEEIDLEHELLESGEVELAKVCQPKIQFSLTSADCMRQYEFRNQMRELELGKIVTVEKEEGVWYYPALLCIELDLDKSDSFSMQFANALKLDDWGFTYGDLMSSAASTSRQVTANWQNITAYSKDKAEISALIKDPLSSTLRASFANMTNQEFTVNENGVLGRRFANENRDSFEDEQVWLINNVMLFTDDNWETARAAFGKITYTDDNNQPVTAYGLIGEAIIGNLLMGETLKIRNENSSIILDKNGIMIKNGSTVVLSADIDGNLTARGTIFARHGDIAGWTIAEDGMYKNGTGISSSDDDQAPSLVTDGSSPVRFYAGDTNKANAPFCVLEDGSLYARGIEITGGKISGSYIEIPNATISAAHVNEIKFAGTNVGLYADSGQTVVASISASVYVEGTYPFFMAKVHIACTGTLAQNVNVDVTMKFRGREADTGQLTTLTLPGSFELTPGTNQTYVFDYSIPPIFGSRPNASILGYSPSTVLGSILGVVSSGNFLPNTDASVSSTPVTGLSLGAPDRRWLELYCARTVINGSSRLLKRDIQSFPESFDVMFDNLHPRIFKYNRQISDRTHYGFILDEVGDALSMSGLTPDDCGAYCLADKTNPSGDGGLRYTEFIALNTWQIQKLKRRVAELENIVAQLQNE